MAKIIETANKLAPIIENKLKRDSAKDRPLPSSTSCFGMKDVLNFGSTVKS